LQKLKFLREDRPSLLQAFKGFEGEESLGFEEKIPVKDWGPV
jgi:hypothetical protein